MPTYEYECGACGHRFEEWQTITSDPLKKCPECKKNKLVRLLGTGGAILFKGSGFYITDYRSDGYKKAAKSDSDSTSSSSGSTESKGSESKPTTSESKSEKPAAKESKPSKKETK